MLSKFVSIEMLFLADRHIFDTYLNIWATCTIMVGFHTFMDDGKCVVGVGFHFNIAQLRVQIVVQLRSLSVVLYKQLEHISVMAYYNVSKMKNNLKIVCIIQL